MNNHFTLTDILAKKNISILLLFICLNINAWSNTYNVTQTSDGNATNQLRGAILAADAAGPGPHTVNIPAGTYNLTLGEITFGNSAQNISIIGAGSASTIINMTSTAQDRIFLINPPGTVDGVQTTISGIKFTNGYLTSDAYGGGAIICGGPNNITNITNCAFENNTATTYPGGGAISNQGGGTFTVNNCTFTNNKVTNADANSSCNGGAISVLYYGSTIPVTGSTSISDCTFTDNYVAAGFATTGGALYLSANYSATSTSYSFSIQKNIFTNNHANASSSGAMGGGIYITSSFAANINYNTFKNNYINTSTSESLAVDKFGNGATNATNNWWNCNDEPQTAGSCSERAKLLGTTGTATLVTSPRLVLKLSSASSTLCPSNYTTLVTASFLSNSDNTAISVGNLSRVIGLPISFSASNGNLSSAQTSIQSNGTATVNFTGTSAGAASINGLVGSLTASDNIAKASITLGNNPTITSQPSNISGCPSGTSSMTVTGSSNTAMTYQWYVGSTPLSNNGVTSGVTTNTLTFTNPTATNNATNYKVTITNGCNAVNSNNVSMSLYSNHVYVIPGGTGQGTSWADAAGDLNAATTLALSCSNVTEIWVKTGTYKPVSLPYPGTFTSADTRDRAFFLTNNIKLYGGFAGTETTLAQRNPGLNPTILSGDIGTANNNSDNCYHVVVSVSNNNSAQMDGFVVKDGNANLPSSTVTINGMNTNRYIAGGLYMHSSSPNINNCVFTGNNGIYGGGAYSYEAGSPTISNCVFASNSATTSGGGYYSGFNGTPSLMNCTIWGNTAPEGGGIYSYLISVPVFTNTIIWGNTGGSVASSFSTPVINNSIVEGGYGSNMSSNPLFTNSADPDGADNIWMSGDDGLRISPNSPAYNNGTATGAPIRDIVGNARPYLGGIDIGAYENIVTPLPLELLSFNGKWQNQQVLLHWETAEEEGMVQFIIMRSKDGITFDEIGKMKPQNGRNNYYDFIDEHPLKDNNFYKLSMEDADGTMAYSNIVMLSYKQFQSVGFSMYPNPANAQVMIQANDAASHLLILDNTGRKVFETQMEKGINTINLSDFGTGIYNVITETNGHISKKQLVVQK